MILKALYDYYERSKDLAPEGMEYKEIAYLIVIDEEGNFIRLENCFIDNKRCSTFLVPKSVSRSSNPVANIAWDNPSYVLNFSEANLPMKNPPTDLVKLKQEEGKRLKDIEKNTKNSSVFREKIRDLYHALPENRTIRAISLFYDKYQDRPTDVIKDDVLWEDLCKHLTKNISFKINGETTIAPENGELNAWLRRTSSDNEDEGNKQLCLVTGECGPIAETTKATPIMGSQATAKLVSFQVSSGYDSYGKTKGFNAPISKEAEFKYTTALNHLLDKNSRNLYRIGTRSYVFWASSRSEASVEMEENFFSFLNPNFENEDNPDKHVEHIEKVFKAVFSGVLKTTDQDRFYILGLAPNAARIAVVYWKEIPIRDFASNLLRHFDDMEIIDDRKEKKPYKGIYSILQAIALQGKVSDVQPNLPESTIKSILQGTLYPYSLYMACLRRIRAEQQTFVTRTAILKAYLNRKSNHKKLTVMLDKSNNNIGYLCGRLFATLEYLQKRSSGIDTIRQRYMNAASTTPATVFSNLMNLSVHHEDKLDKGGLIFFQNTKDEIIQLMPASGFPAHLDIEDQGRFFIGYHHQRAEFYKPKENKESNAE